MILKRRQCSDECPRSVRDTGTVLQLGSAHRPSGRHFRSQTFGTIGPYGAPSGLLNEGGPSTHSRTPAFISRHRSLFVRMGNRRQGVCRRNTNIRGAGPKATSWGILGRPLAHAIAGPDTVGSKQYGTPDVDFGRCNTWALYSQRWWRIGHKESVS
jgi:hypothetical protein